MRNNTFIYLVVMSLAAAGPSLAGVNDVTLTLVPVGGTSVSAGDIVAVEAFITFNITTRHEGGQWDLPCTIFPQPGGSGTLTAVGGCLDCDMDGANTSSGGVAFIFGPSGLAPHAGATCITAVYPCIGCAPPLINAGVTRYLGTVNYEVSDCASGSFDLSFECTDQLGEICDNVPEASNTTRLREDVPVQPAAGPLLSLDMVGTTLTLPEVGSCCTSVGGCIDDGVTESCCLSTLGGEHWHAGQLCSDAAACHGDVGTGFTYQGSLEKPAGTPLTDTCTFEFRLCYDDGAAVCTPGTVSNHPGVEVIDGLFTVHDVDFGPGAFNGDARWMEVHVQCTDDSGLIALSPRVEVSPTPHALVTAAAPWDGLTDVPPGFADNIDDVGTSTLDQAYDGGGAGAGRTITADGGAVNIAGPDGLTVTGNVGIGTAVPNSQVHINGDGTAPSLRVQVTGLTRFLVSDSGGVSVGSAATSPANGLYVFGNVGIGSSAPPVKLNVVGGTAASLADGTGNILSGSESGANLVIDTDEIQSRSNGIAADLQLNRNGGAVIIGSTLDGALAINRPTASHPVHVGTNPLDGNGAHLTASGTWTNGSDRNFKQNFESVDAREILNKVVKMPVTRWQYKGEEPSVRHIGPMAQDFRAAFGLGHDERYITTIDSEGVALAAIQGLHQVVEEKDCEIRDLQSRLAAMEKLVAELAGTRKEGGQ